MSRYRDASVALHYFLLSDVNDCADPSSCHPNATCTNFDGGFECDCLSGFLGDGINNCNGELSIPTFAHCAVRVSRPSRTTLVLQSSYV